jgi:hypothetical protein
MTTAPVIVIERDEFLAGTEQARRDWARITGKEMVLKPDIFRHTGTGVGYADIAGGIAYPTTMPGCLIVMGITSAGKLHVLEFMEEVIVFDLIRAAVAIRTKYGYGLSKDLLQAWTGDQEKYLPIVAKVSQKLEERLGFDRGFYVKDPVDYREPYAFPLYIRQIHNALKSRQLLINSQDLTNHLQAFHPDMAEKGRIQEFPAVGLLGGLVHTLITEAPWEERAESGEPIIVDEVTNNHPIHEVRS